MPEPTTVRHNRPPFLQTPRHDTAQRVAPTSFRLLPLRSGAESPARRVVPPNIFQPMLDRTIS